MLFHISIRQLKLRKKYFSACSFFRFAFLAPPQRWLIMQRIDSNFPGCWITLESCSLSGRSSQLLRWEKHSVLYDNNNDNDNDNSNSNSNSNSGNGNSNGSSNIKLISWIQIYYIYVKVILNRGTPSFGIKILQDLIVVNFTGFLMIRQN